MQDEFAGAANPRDLWDGLIANRDSKTAKTWARSMPEKDIKQYLGMPLDLITDKETQIILSSWFLQDHTAIDENTNALS